MKLLVLGTNGQVGWELLRALAPLGEIAAADRGSANFEQPGALRQIVDKSAPDIVVNAVAYTAVDKAESEAGVADRINHQAVVELAAAAADRDAWLIHYSTDYVFDGAKAGPYVETDVTAPLGIYGRTKRDGESAIAAANPRHLILRTSWVHSARGNNFVRTILRLAAERDSLRIVADQHGAPTSAELIADVTAHAVAAISAGRAPDPGLYHLTATGETTWHGLAQLVVAEGLAAGLPLRTAPDRVQPITTSEYPTPARRPPNSRLDTGKLRAALNLALPDWTFGVKRSVAELALRAAK